jgi:NADH-quinone oxidoreductase subunit C
MRACTPDQWHGEWEHAAADGACWLDFLAGIDRVDRIEVIGRALRPDGTAGELLSTEVVDDSLTSITDLFPGAAWYEREIAEMLGLHYEGLADERPLLRRTEHGAPPLRKSTVLAARVVKPWPGNQPGKRPQRAPGAIEGWLDAP